MLADEALACARAAGDYWEIAQASCSKAVAAQSIADLRERVDTAAALLTKAGIVQIDTAALAFREELTLSREIVVRPQAYEACAASGGSPW